MSTETVPPVPDITVARRHASIAALVMAVCFTVHAVNGLVVERFFLGFETYTDYADVDKLRDALGSPAWLTSGFAHLVTGVAVVVLGTNLARIVGGSSNGSRTIAEYLRYASLAAGVGFTLLGVADVQGSQTVKLLADQNPELDRTAFLVLSVIVPVVNGLAIVALGWVILLFARYARREGTGVPGWFVVLSYVAGASGLLIAIAYVPVYLFLFLAWLWCLTALLRGGGPVSRTQG